MNFSEKLVNNYSEIKNNFKHPWYTYLGSSIAILIIVCIVLSALLFADVGK